LPLCYGLNEEVIQIMLKLLALAGAAMAITLSTSIAASAQQDEKPRKVTHTHHLVQSATVQRNDPNAVYYGGTYFGSDPDPRIRAELRRTAGAAVGGR
jgi:hypothetical protein